MAFDHPPLSLSSHPSLRPNNSDASRIEFLVNQIKLTEITQAANCYDMRPAGQVCLLETGTRVARGPQKKFCRPLCYGDRFDVDSGSGIISFRLI